MEINSVNEKNITLGVIQKSCVQLPLYKKEFLENGLWVSGENSGGAGGYVISWFNDDVIRLELNFDENCFKVSSPTDLTRVLAKGIKGKSYVPFFILEEPNDSITLRVIEN